MSCALNRITQRCVLSSFLRSHTLFRWTFWYLPALSLKHKYMSTTFLLRGQRWWPVGSLMRKHQNKDQIHFPAFTICPHMKYRQKVPAKGIEFLKIFSDFLLGAISAKITYKLWISKELTTANWNSECSLPLRLKLLKVIISIFLSILRGFPGGSEGKESACNVGDPGLIPRSGWSPGERMATHSSILAWRISWTEKPGRLQFIGSQRVGYNWVTNISIHDSTIQCENEHSVNQPTILHSTDTKLHLH